MRRRTDEGHAGFGDGFGEVGTFGEEAVAGVDCVYAGAGGGVDDFGDGEVGLYGAEVVSDLVGFVGFEAVEGEFIFGGVDGDGADAEFAGGAEDADSDLAAVGDEDCAERRFWGCHIFYYSVKLNNYRDNRSTASGISGRFN